MMGIERARWPRGSTVIGLAGALLWLFAIAYPVVKHMGGDPRFLLRLGSMWEHPTSLHGVRFDGPAGYDGQFYAVLATDPFLLRPGAERFFDAPAYRASRAGLPLPAWALGFGDDTRAILSYQLLCWTIGALLTWAVARWLEDRGASAWWAALLVFQGGIVSSMYSSLPDAAAAALMVVALWLHARGTFRPSLGVMAWACLVKETTLIAAAAVGLAEWRAGRRGRAVLSVTIPSGLVFAWRVWVLSRLGTGNVRVTGNNFGIPFAWLPEKLASALDIQEGIALVGLALLLFAAGALSLALRPEDTAVVALAGFALLAVFLNHFVYGPSWWNYTRVLMPLPALAVLAGVRGPPWRRWLGGLATLPWAVVGGMMLPRLAIGCGAATLAMAAWDLRRRARPPEGASHPPPST